MRPRGTITLCIDIGGTGIKAMRLDARERPVSAYARTKTPKPAAPRAVLATIAKLASESGPFDRVAIGFPGVVEDGVTKNAPNLGNRRWRDVRLAALAEQRLRKPARVINDADLQGYGVVEGRGVELVITLGTGMGSALFVDGVLVPNLELGHHPFRGDRTYEDDVSDAELARIGAGVWRRRVRAAIETTRACFNWQRLHLGGGNARFFVGRRLPVGVRLFTNEEALRGGVRLFGA